MIPFLDLQAINARFEVEFQAKFKQFLDKGWYILGNEVKAFETAFASYCNVNYGIGTANGLDAIRLVFEGYKVLGELVEDDEVLVPANTYIASVLAVSQAGLKPVFVDANLDTMNMDIAQIEKAITPKTKAILVVHLYGQLMDMDAVAVLAKKYKLLIIEDAAQAHGAKSKTYKLGNAVAFSFYPTKNLGALADAGMILTNDKALTETVRKLRNYGQNKKYIAKYKGFNSRLDEIQATFLQVKLPFLAKDNVQRIALAKQYDKEISNPLILKPKFTADGSHIFHQYVIRSKYRNALQVYLQEQGVQTIVHYPVAPHQQEAYAEYNHLSFPNAERLASEVLSLPISPLLTVVQQQTVINLINQFGN